LACPVRVIHLLLLLDELLLELLHQFLLKLPHELLLLLLDELLLELLDELLAEAVPAPRAIVIPIAPMPAVMRVQVLVLGTAMVHLIFIENAGRGRPGCTHTSSRR